MTCRKSQRKQQETSPKRAIISSLFVPSKWMWWAFTRVFETFFIICRNLWSKWSSKFVTEVIRGINSFWKLFKTKVLRRRLFQCWLSESVQTIRGMSPVENGSRFDFVGKNRKVIFFVLWNRFAPLSFWVARQRYLIKSFFFLRPNLAET